MDDQAEVEKVRVAIRRTRGAREHDRIVAVNMVRIKGYTVQAAADILCVDRGTVHNWLDAYARRWSR